jgi:hypothetical protein
MDFHRDDVITPSNNSEQSQARPAAVPFDDMMGSLPPTRPMPRPAERQPINDMMGSLPPTRPIMGSVEQQPGVLPTPIQTQPRSLQKPKNKRLQRLPSWLLPVVGGVIAVIAIVLSGYLSYSSQHKKVVSLDGQVLIFNQHISDQQHQITLLQETVPTLSPNAASYTGWTSHTLKYEGATFQYPKSWTLSDTSANGSDVVSITSLNNFVITINTGAAVPPASTTAPNIIGFTPINFGGKFGYFDFSSTADDGAVEEATLSQSPSNALKTFPSKAVGEHPGTPGNFTITAGYSSSGSNTGESQTLVNADKDASYQTAELLIDSMTY